MRRAEAAVGAEVRCRHDATGRCVRSHESIIAEVRGAHLDADLEIDDIVEIESDVSTRAGDVLRSKRVPDESTRFGNNLAEILLRRLATNDGQRDPGVLFDTN